LPNLLHRISFIEKAGTGIRFICDEARALTEAQERSQVAEQVSPKSAPSRDPNHVPGGPAAWLSFNAHRDRRFGHLYRYHPRLDDLQLWRLAEEAGNAVGFALHTFHFQTKIFWV
jgi:hypothetical protein